MVLTNKVVYGTCGTVFAISAGIIYVLRRVEREIDNAAAGGFIFD
jgi:hypothetical protein